MVKKLIKIALLTGAAHVFTIITLKLLAQYITPAQIGHIGEIDSLFQLIISVISFGLQLSAVRDIASAPDWKSVYSQTQVARNTLAILLMPLAFLYFFKSPYLYFALAPIFALNGDYALYGKGRPVAAALLAFCRVLVPSLVLVVCSVWLRNYLIPAYVVSTALIYWITGLVITRWLHSPYWYKPLFKSLLLYIQSISLGVVTLASYIIGLGLIVVATHFYDDTTIAVAYLGLKLYMIFKGVLRIINQAFVKEMLDDEVCLKVDYIAGFAGLAFAAALAIFPQSIIRLFFNEQYQQHGLFLLLMGAAGLAAAAFTSLTTRSMLQHKDKPYARYAAAAAVTSMALVVGLSFVFEDPLSFGIALIAGELLTTLGLIWINKDIRIGGRLTFLLQAALLLCAPVAIRLLWGDNRFAMIGGMALFAAGGSFLLFKHLNNLQPAKQYLI